MTKSRPVLITMSILAGLQVLTAGAGLADIIGKDMMSLFVLAVAAVQAGIQFYVQAQVVPLGDVAAYIDKKGDTVSGPAAPPAEEPAEVVKQDEVEALPAEGEARQVTADTDRAEVVDPLVAGP